MSTPTFSICHATARMPDGWWPSCSSWFRNADTPENVEYILSVHAFDASMIKPQSSLTIIHLCGYGDPRNSVHGWNVAAEHSTGRILILNADDFFPPEHWDTLLLSKILPCPSSNHREFAIHVSTGNPDTDWDRRLMALGIISRPLYQRWGYALYPEYESMESDVDMWEHAKQDGVIIEAFDLVFEHRHVSLGKSPDDEVYRKQNRPEAYALGKQIIERRRAERFAK
jgi:hypothetical protein